MKILPESTFNFTIPSQKDGVTLECRIYHPNSVLSAFDVSENELWKRKGAIVTHPYAPFGGNMDDPVVSLIAATCLGEGFIVGTFNFRGAGSSTGNTSWQSTAEQNDYKSFIGFMVYYLHKLSIPSPTIKQNKSLHDFKVNECDQIHLASQVSTGAPLSPKNEPRCGHTENRQDASKLNSRIQLLLAGYSYGSLITMILPAKLQVILAPFETAVVDSNYAKIRQQAEYLAEQQSSQLPKRSSSPFNSCKQDIMSSDNTRETSSIFSTAKSSKNPIGSVESPEILDRSFHHPICSSLNENKTCEQGDNFEKVEKTHGSESSMSRPASHTSQLSPSLKGDDLSFNQTTSSEKPQHSMQVTGDDFDVAYLLVSPLQGLVYDFLTMWSYRIWGGKERLTEIETKLTAQPTLAIFGDRDVFVSLNTLRGWAKKLAIENGEENRRSRFRYTEVKEGDHFWRSPKHVKKLQAEIEKFVKELCSITHVIN